LRADPKLVEELGKTQENVKVYKAENVRLNGLLEENKKQINELMEKNTSV